MEQERDYYAFISYKREDENWAKWLQHKLEHYHFPINLNGRTDLPKYIRPTFRDVTDLTPGLLAEEIDKALHSSEWLVIICSPRSAKSLWVGKEAQAFIDLGRADHIIPFVIEGNPFSIDANTECYPEALLKLTGSKELLAANINEMGRDAAVIKVVARMFNLRFDTLWQRYRREENAQKRKLKDEKWTLQYNQGRVVASICRKKISEGEIYMAARLCSYVFPRNLKRINKPFVPEVAGALRQIYDILHFSVSYSPLHTWRNPIFQNDNELYVSNNGDFIAVTSEWNDWVDFIRVRDGKHIKSLYCHDIDFGHKDGCFVISTDTGFEIWDTKTWKTIKKERFKNENGISIKSVSFSDNDKTLILTAETFVVVYDLGTSNYVDICIHEKEHFFPIKAIMNHSMNLIAVIDISAEAYLVDINGHVLATMQFEDMNTDIVNPFLFFSDDDSVLFFYSSNAFLQSYDLNTFRNQVDVSFNRPSLYRKKIINLDVDWFGAIAFPSYSNKIDVSPILSQTFNKTHNVLRFEALASMPSHMLAGVLGDGSVMILKKGDVQRKSLFLHSHYSFRKCLFIPGSSSVICLATFKNRYRLEAEIWDLKLKTRQYRINSIENDLLVDVDYDDCNKTVYLAYSSGLILGWNTELKKFEFKYTFIYPTLIHENDVSPFSEKEADQTHDMCLIGSHMLGILTFPSYEIRILDITTKQEFSFGKHFLAHSILYIEDQSLLLVISEITVYVWSVKRKKLIGSIKLEYEILHVVNCGHGVCSVLLKSGHISLINLKKMDIIKEKSFPNEGLSILYNKYDDTLLVLQADYTIAEYSAKHLAFIYSFNIQEYMPNFEKDLFFRTFCLSPDGLYIIIDKWKFKYPRLKNVCYSIVERFSKAKLTSEEKYEYYLEQE